jgi:hypothetical protein
LFVSYRFHGPSFRVVMSEFPVDDQSDGDDSTKLPKAQSPLAKRRSHRRRRDPRRLNPKVRNLLPFMFQIYFTTLAAVFSSLLVDGAIEYNSRKCNIISIKKRVGK